MNYEALGPYDLHEPIGRGGMGTVHLGINRDTGRKVAVKILAPAFAADAGFRERFEAEIKSLEKLKHPNIVELYGYGEQNGVLFYGMELVPGTNLQRELTNGRRFHWREVIRIAIAICSALKHAHDHGVVHRDIKPANLLLTEDEQVKLSDFGIAKLFGGTQITVDGGVVGTADYMSPEQAEGIGATNRSDLYSLGGVLYCLLTGRPPFQGKSIAEVIHKVRYDTPIRAKRLAEDIPEELDLVVKQLLSKSPEDRVPTARALSNRLKAIQHALSIRDDAADGGILRMTTAGTIHSPDLNNMSEEEFANLETAVEPSMAAPPVGGVTPTNDSATALPAEVSKTEPPAERRTHFTSVDEDHRRSRLITDEEPEESTWSQLAAVACLIALLGLIGFTVWQLRKPPSADKLFSKIRDAAAAGPEELMHVEGSVRSFLKRFPNDPRVAEAEADLEEIELERLQRQLDVTSRLRSSASRTLAPVEQALVDAIRQEALNPVTASEDLAAIIMLFESDPEATEREKQCIRLARRNLRRLNTRIQRNAQTYVSVLQERVAAARELMKTDPVAGRQILESLIHLYDGTPWAKEVVEQAQEVVRNPPPLSPVEVHPVEVTPADAPQHAAPAKGNGKG